MSVTLSYVIRVTQENENRFKDKRYLKHSPNTISWELTSDIQHAKRFTSSKGAMRFLIDRPSLDGEVVEVSHLPESKDRKDRKHISMFEQLFNMPVHGNAYDDRPLFDLAHVAITDPKQPPHVKAYALLKLDYAMIDVLDDKLRKAFFEGDKTVIKEQVAEYLYEGER